MKNYSVIAIVVMASSLLFCSEISLVSCAFSPNLKSIGQSETTVTLSWSQSNELFFENYNVAYSTEPNGPFNGYSVIKDKGTTSIVVSGLTADTGYYFVVYDKDSVSGTTQSNTYYQKTSATPALSVSDKTSSTTSLKWACYNAYSSQAPFQKYVISMSTNGGAWSTVTTLTDQYLTTYAVTGLSPGTYSFQISDYVGATGQLLGVSQSNVVNARLVESLSVHIQTPANTTVLSGQQLQLSVDVTGGTGSYSYQWYLDGSAVTGGASTYTFSPTDKEPSTSHSIYAVVSDSDGTTATSNYINLYVPITITLLPFDATPTPTQNPYPTNTAIPATANNNDGILALLAIAAIIMGIIIVGVIVYIKRPKNRVSPGS